MNSTRNSSGPASLYNLTSPAYASVLFILFAVDVLGNSLVCIVSSKKLKKKVTPLQIFTLSLAIADLLQGVCQILPHSMVYFRGYWAFGTVLCKTHAMTRFLCSNTSVITMAFIAIIRYKSVDKMQWPYTNRCLAVALSIWLFNIGTSVPFAVWFEVVDNACMFRGEHFYKAKIFTVVTIVTNFFIPLVICCLCYIGVIRKTLQSSRRVTSWEGTNAMKRVKVNRNVTITCMLVVGAFAVTWTPFQIVLLVSFSNSYIVARQRWPLLKYFMLPTVVNSCLNPFIYGCVWKNFRSEIRTLFRVGRPVRVAPQIATVQKSLIIRDKNGELSLTSVHPLDICTSNDSISTCPTRQCSQFASHSGDTEKIRMSENGLRRHTTPFSSDSRTLRGILRQNSRRKTVPVTFN